MRISGYINFCRINCGALLIVFLLLLNPVISVFGQEPPPRPVTVTVTASLSFGTFTLGASGGTVTLTAAGARSSTGDVILLSWAPVSTTAMYEIVGNPGTVFSLLNGPDATLSGGGGTLLLHIGDSNPASPFVIATTPPVPTVMTVGGTLTVGTLVTNPPGSYSGTFNITFVQE